MINTSFTLLQSNDVTKAQSGYRILNSLGLWLPFVALLFGAIGVWLAANHRRALIGLGLGVAASMLVLGAGLSIARPIYLNAVPTAVLPRNTAGIVYDTLVRFLRDALRATALAGIVIAAGAFLTGPSVTAVKTRDVCVSGIGRLRGTAESAGMRTGTVGAWTYAHKRLLHIGVVVLGLVGPDAAAALDHRRRDPDYGAGRHCRRRDRVHRAAAERGQRHPGRVMARRPQIGQA